MLAAASIAVPARPDLVVETAVDLVLLRPEDGGEVVRHAGGSGGARGFVRLDCMELLCDGIYMRNGDCSCARW